LQSLDGEGNDFTDEMDTCNHFDYLLGESDVDWGDVKQNGANVIPETAEDEFNELIETARNYGLFIVEVGELEGWLDLGISKGPEWVIEALDEIDDGNCSEELRRFVAEIQDYLNQQYRELVVAESVSE